jgi:hypothetical protein
LAPAARRGRDCAKADTGEQTIRDPGAYFCGITFVPFDQQVLMVRYAGLQKKERTRGKQFAED